MKWTRCRVRLGAWLIAGASLVACAWPVGLARAQDAAGYAQQLFTSGTAHYAAREFAAALEDFRGALSLYASPNTRLYLGRTYRELGNLPLAIVELERASREAADRVASDPRFERTRDVARTEAAELVARVGRIAIVGANVPPGARVTVGGVEVPAAAIGAPIRVMPGAVEIVVEAAGYETIRRSTEVTGGQTASVELNFAPVAQPAQPAPVEPAVRSVSEDVRTPPPEEPGASPLTLVGGVSLSVGGALAIAAIVTGILTANQYSELEAACRPDGGCPADRASDISSGSSLATASTVLTVGAVTVGALGLVLIALGAGSGSGSSERESVRIVPGPALAGGGVAWSF